MRAYPTPAMATHPSTSGTDVSMGRKGSGPRKTKQMAVMKLPMTERRTGLDKILSETCNQMKTVDKIGIFAMKHFSL